jgi:23S rRNA pseudouridine955/2504/2580 synthase
MEIGTDDAGRRADRILRIVLSAYPLSFIHKAIRKGNILLNGRRFKPNTIVQKGDVLELEPSYEVDDRPKCMDLPTSLLDPSLIILENDTFLVLNKPVGILVHDASNSLEPMVRNYLADKDSGSISFTPGPLHRLDRNTSGIIVFSKTLFAAQNFSKAMQDRKFIKAYLAIVEGELTHEVSWDDDVQRELGSRKTNIISQKSEVQMGFYGTKHAKTEVYPIASNSKVSLVQFIILTGRTHQIRTQAAHHGHPLCCDAKYGGSPLPSMKSSYYFLHAWKLKTKFEPVQGLPPEIEAPLPDYFFQTIEKTFLLDKNEVYSKLAHIKF